MTARHRVCRHHTPVRIAAAAVVLLTAIGVATARGTALGHADAQNMCTVTTTEVTEP